MILFGSVIPDKPQKILHVLLRPVRAIKSVPSANSKSKKNLFEVWLAFVEISNLHVMEQDSLQENEVVEHPCLIPLCCSLQPETWSSIMTSKRGRSEHMRLGTSNRCSAVCKAEGRILLSNALLQSGFD